MSQGELMVMFGPPAVGKMTVGRAVCERSNFRLFLNHHTIEPLADVFGMGTAPFRTLTGEFRRRVIEEAAAADVALILTMVWNLGGVETPGGWANWSRLTPTRDSRSRSSNLRPT